jgi:RNA recognition motif-containing protein
MKFQLFLTNLPYNCSDSELQSWIESHGIQTLSVRIVRDLVSGVSPAFGYVELKNDKTMNETIAMLNGRKMRNQLILVKEAPVRSLSGLRSAAQKTT